jgi:hypothetical protein
MRRFIANMNKPKITWKRAHPIEGREGRWRCSLEGTQAGWGDTPLAAYEHWELWKLHDHLRRVYKLDDKERV